ncbi:MAG: FkbM family methyltransferase [Rhodocyclales bacterium]|nr:FkbM family methyltransferase [Rhodocyclales bacterium]
MPELSLPEQILAVLPTVRERHDPRDLLHVVLKQAAHQAYAVAFSDPAGGAVRLAPFGELRFPYVRMGAVDSVNLFDLDELILFAFYHLNRTRYHKVADIGGNLGLHSLMLARCGFEVHCYEPDPVHAELLQANLERNSVQGVTLVRAAVSSEAGELEFVRVKGNTTGSHLAGAKANPYGELERFPVRVEAMGPILERADFLKIDAEGHEAEILCATPPQAWRGKEAVVEVGSAENAERIFAHFHGGDVRLFAQRLNWGEVTRRDDMPESYKHGSLFIGGRGEPMPWGAA